MIILIKRFLWDYTPSYSLPVYAPWIPRSGVPTVLYWTRHAWGIGYRKGNYLPLVTIDDLVDQYNFVAQLLFWGIPRKVPLGIVVKKFGIYIWKAHEK